MAKRKAVRRPLFVSVGKHSDKTILLGGLIAFHIGRQCIIDLLSVFIQGDVFESHRPVAGRRSGRSCHFLILVHQADIDIRRTEAVGVCFSCVALILKDVGDTDVGGLQAVQNSKAVQHVSVQFALVALRRFLPDGVRRLFAGLCGTNPVDHGLVPVGGHRRLPLAGPVRGHHKGIHDVLGRRSLFRRHIRPGQEEDKFHLILAKPVQVVLVIPGFGHREADFFQLMVIPHHKTVLAGVGNLRAVIIRNVVLDKHQPVDIVTGGVHRKGRGPLVPVVRKIVVALQNLALDGVPVLVTKNQRHRLRPPAVLVGAVFPEHRHRQGSGLPVGYGHNITVKLFSVFRNLRFTGDKLAAGVRHLGKLILRLDADGAFGILLQLDLLLPGDILLVGIAVRLVQRHRRDIMAGLSVSVLHTEFYLLRQRIRRAFRHHPDLLESIVCRFRIVGVGHCKVHRVAPCHVFFISGKIRNLQAEFVPHHVRSNLKIRVVNLLLCGVVRTHRQFSGGDQLFIVKDPEVQRRVGALAVTVLVVLPLHVDMKRNTLHVQLIHDRKSAVLVSLHAGVQIGSSAISGFLDTEVCKRRIHLECVAPAVLCSDR